MRVCNYYEYDTFAQDTKEFDVMNPYCFAASNL